MGGDGAYFIIRGVDLDPIQGIQNNLRNSTSQVNGENWGRCWFWTKLKPTYKLKISSNSSDIVQDCARSSYAPFSIKGWKSSKEVFERNLCENLRITLNRWPKLIRPRIFHPTPRKMSAFTLLKNRLRLTARYTWSSISKHCSCIDYGVLDCFAGGSRWPRVVPQWTSKRCHLYRVLGFCHVRQGIVVGEHIFA